MNPQGTWYLTYSYNDGMFEYYYEDGIQVKEIPLKATTEAEAIVEGQAKWADKKWDEVERWKKWEADKKKRRKQDIRNKKYKPKDPPTEPFQDGPWCPIIIYKIPL